MSTFASILAGSHGLYFLDMLDQTKYLEIHIQVRIGLYKLLARLIFYLKTLRCEKKKDAETKNTA